MGGTFWDLAHVDDQGWNINASWFADSTPARRRMQRKRYGGRRRQSDAMSDEIYQSATRSKGKGSKAVRRWAVNLCKYEEQQKNATCEVPEEGYDDCSDAEIDEATGDVKYSLEEMLAKRGNTECMRHTISTTYEWAAGRGQLKSLCAGCFDPFCERAFLRGKCGRSQADDAQESAKAVYLPAITGGESEMKKSTKMYGDELYRYLQSHFSTQLALVLALVASVLCNVMFVTHCVCSTCNRRKTVYKQVVDDADM